MSRLRTTFAAGLLVAGVAGAALWADQGPAGLAQFVTREWSWSSGSAVTSFTAWGPAEEVNALDPREDPLDCEGCFLASSIQFTPEDGSEGASDDAAVLTEVSE